MRILFLYNNSVALPLIDWLAEQHCDVTLCKEKLTRDFFMGRAFDLIVSYNYKYILSSEIIECVNGNAVNLHISYLPWNKGASPNLWSFIDNTVKGVTIHYMDSTLDTGDIIAQREVNLFSSDSLSKSYYILHQEIQSLFKTVFAEHEKWPVICRKMSGGGSFHSVKQSKELLSIIPSYEISADEMIRLVKEKLPNILSSSPSGCVEN